jgi:hypothetical protein
LSGTSLRKFELAQTLFRFNIPDDQDPAPHIATMTSAHCQLVQGGENMSDSLFAMSLPASFDQQKQAIWMQGDKLTSDMVATAARGEWSCCLNNIAAEANKAFVKPTSAQANLLVSVAATGVTTSATTTTTTTTTTTRPVASIAISIPIFTTTTP